MEKFKNHLSDRDGILSDEDILITNRKNYLISQVSPSHGFLERLQGARNYSLTDRSFYSFCESQFRDRNTIEFVVMNAELTAPTFYLWLRQKNIDATKLVYFIQQPQKLEIKSSILNKYYENFIKKTENKLPLQVEHPEYAIALCDHTKTGSTLTAVELVTKLYKEATILIKDYGRTKTSDVREVFEKKYLTCHVNLEGHAVINYAAVN